MSWPRWTWASKIGVLFGSSLQSCSSQNSISCWARWSASSTPGIYPAAPRSGAAVNVEHVTLDGRVADGVDCEHELDADDVRRIGSRADELGGLDQSSDRLTVRHGHRPLVSDARHDV